jgi:putative protease
MATKRKAKRKTSVKRKKTPVRSAAKRKKTGTPEKKRAKAPARRASPKKEARVKPAVKPPSARRLAPLPAAATAAPMPSTPAQPTLREERIGVVTHYYNHLSVAIIRLESGTLRIGDTIHIRGHTTDLQQKVESLEVEHAPATEVGPNDDFGLKVVDHAREHDVVYKVRS